MNTNTDLIKVINSYYTNTLLKIGSQNRENTEDDNLYYLSFWGLLRCGYPFTLAENAIEDQESDNAGEKAEDSEAVTEKVVRISLDDKIFSCEIDALKERFGTKTVSIMLDDRPGIGSVEENGGDDEIVLPYADFGDKDDTSVNGEHKEEAKQREAKQPKNLIPYIPSDSRYPDDPVDRKEYDTFLFNSHSIDISFHDGRKAHFEAVVYPVYMDESDSLATDIFVIVSDEIGRIRSGMSDMEQNGQKGVSVEFEGLRLIFRGEWKGGRFQTNCKIMSYIDSTMKLSLKEKVVYVVPSNRTSSYYLRHKGKDGTYINVFPLKVLKNDNVTGLVPSALIIEDGNSRKIYTSDSNMRYLLGYDGQQQIISVFWRGPSLHISLDNQNDL